MATTILSDSMFKYSILLMFNCRESTGYAIEKLEALFLSTALHMGYTNDQIFWLYNGLNSQNNNKISCNYHNPTNYLSFFLKQNNIKMAIALDLGFPKKILNLLKTNGVNSIISYQGASMSSINKGVKLLLKKLEFHLRKNIPDHFIFESEAMRMTATHGRGIPFEFTSVVNLGVDTKKYYPENNCYYAHDQFSLPYSTKIIFYSGHFEERKGVRVIIKAAIDLVENHKVNDLHFLLCGNKGNEAQPFIELLADSVAKNSVTFAGYRNDIPHLMRSSYIGVIASTGWDSFTMSSVEMMASGLPLIVSDLQGLSETIEDSINGFKIAPGDYIDLAEKIKLLCLNHELAKKFSMESRKRALEKFSIETQIVKFAKILQRESPIG